MLLKQLCMAYGWILQRDIAINAGAPLTSTLRK
jgi:hypothetical protein